MHAVEHLLFFPLTVGYGLNWPGNDLREALTIGCMRGVNLTHVKKLHLVSCT